ncbi:MAG TPA: hypothetical protein VMA32_15830 [Streptosporangiaceae bacterium]|nr:hypothetical protein [Streptosporangiaceae bacterium]
MDSLLSGGARPSRSLAGAPGQPDVPAAADKQVVPDTQAAPDTQTGSGAKPSARAQGLGEAPVADPPALVDTTALADARRSPEAPLPAVELLPTEPAAVDLLPAEPAAVELLPAEPATAGLLPAEPAVTGLLPAEPAATALLPADVGAADLAQPAHLDEPLGDGDLDAAASQAGVGPDASAMAELPPPEIEPQQVDAGLGILEQRDPDGSEPEDLDPDPTVSGRLIPIGLLSGSRRLSLAGVAPDVPAVSGAAAPSASAWLADASQAVRDWASRRSFGLSSACGVSLALAVCAAGWFSAGTRTDILRGVGALWAGYLALKAGQLISAPPQLPPSAQAATHQQQDSERLASSVALDIAAPVILEPGPEPQPQPQGPPQPPESPEAQQPSPAEQPSGVEQSSGAQAGRAAVSGRADALRRPTTAASWLAALGMCLAESVVYIGLALGAAAESWGRAWPIAIAVIGLVAVRSLMTVCSTPPGLGDHPSGVFRKMCAALLTMPVGGRILLVGIVAPIWGAKAALLAVLVWAMISIAVGFAGQAAAGILTADTELSSGKTPSLLLLRDDGALARVLGTVVRGSLLPLPPAVLGLLAVSALALLGMHDLPGVLMVGPAVVMLLAAPGSAHPHAGRFDWLVPSLLLGAQVLYLAAIGFAVRVPPPVIFALVVAVLLRYTDLASGDRPVLLAKQRRPGEDRGERGTALGWEGRLLLAGLAAAMGIATFAYLALTAYLGVLICAKVVLSSLSPQEENARDRTGPGGRR